MEYYSLLSAQPINYEKTEALWSARAWGVHEEAKFQLRCGEHPIKWCTSFKYLGYWISPKIGWSLMIRNSVLKIRQRMGIINGCRIFGATSIEFRRILFSSYVIPIFTWLFAIFPLFSDCQRQYLSHFYYTYLKRVTHNQQWEDLLFAFLAKEISLDNRCTRYWSKYLKSLEGSVDGALFVEQLAVNIHRKEWLSGKYKVHCLRRSKRFIEHSTVLHKCLECYEDNPLTDSIAHIPVDDIELFEEFPGTF